MERFGVSGLFRVIVFFFLAVEMRREMKVEYRDRASLPLPSRPRGSPPGSHSAGSDIISSVRHFIRKRLFKAPSPSV